MHNKAIPQTQARVDKTAKSKTKSCPTLWLIYRCTTCAHTVATRIETHADVGDSRARGMSWPCCRDRIWQCAIVRVCVARHTTRSQDGLPVLSVAAVLLLCAVTLRECDLSSSTQTEKCCWLKGGRVKSELLEVWVSMWTSCFCGKRLG